MNTAKCLEHYRFSDLTLGSQSYLGYPDKTPRELAWQITDQGWCYISESTVFRIFKANDLITSAAFTVLTARDKFVQPTERVNELWQTDFTCLKVVRWGWYYLSTVLADFSRYISPWKPCSGKSARDVKATATDVIRLSCVKDIRFMTRSRLLLDIVHCYLPGELRNYCEDQGIGHVRGTPFCPMTQGKIERHHRLLKKDVLVEHYCSPEELQSRAGAFIDYHNEESYDNSLNNVTELISNVV